MLYAVKCFDRMLHWVIVKVIIAKQNNYGRIVDEYLQVIWVLKKRIKIKWLKSIGLIV